MPSIILILKSPFRIITLIIIAMVIRPASYAQEKCGTVEYTKRLRNSHLLLEGDMQFENWLQQKISERKQRLSTERTQAAPYKIPVVVHVVHKGEAVGIGTNISEAQILSQIAVLNKDFRRLNTDASNTPTEFLPVAGTLDIEFIMAKQDPEGYPTNGIVRVQGTQSTWSLLDNAQLKSMSYWPAEDYMNIWVTDLASPYIGYAQFPVSTLQGLENSPNNRLTDGVVIDYRTFGSNDAGSFNLDANYNKGRTTTHEVGHFFGLRHIWGDDEDFSDACGGSDYVTDTPNQSGSYSSCPSHPAVSCGGNNMFQNFMDYTNDVCMNLFTQGQVIRMSTVLDNSVRRSTLSTSHALNDPVLVANDLGIREIVLPTAVQCASSFVPSIEIRNYGNNTVTSVTIRMRRNTVIQQTRTNVPLNLPPDASTTITFDAQNLSPGNFTFEFEIIQTNGTSDGKPFNNIRTIPVQVPHTITAPFSESFNSTPTTWHISNPDQSITWQNKIAPNISGLNRAMYMNFYGYEDSPGEADILKTPVFDLSAVPTAYVTFDVAYAPFGGSQDALKVFVLTDCEANWLYGHNVYDKSGFDLATAPSSNSAFTPDGPAQWRREIINLSSFIGQSNVQLAFVGINDWGNNLYIDNVNVITSAEEDIAIVDVISPSPVSCNNTVTPRLLIRNKAVTINSFNVVYRINSSNPQIASSPENLILEGGQEIEVTLPPIFLSNGLNILSFELTAPNGIVDIHPEDNLIQVKTIINNPTDRIPLREDFDTYFENRWTIINPMSGNSWETVTTNFVNSVRYKAFNNDTFIGDKAWIVSPVLDFSNASTASLSFDLSYRNRNSANDKLQILASTDCGATFDIIPLDALENDFELSGPSMANNQTTSIEWLPVVLEDWQQNKYVNLNALAGKDSVRIAFIFTNDGGNNLYVDNVEFFVSDNPYPKTITQPYLIYGTERSTPEDFHITFNLKERINVQYQVLDMMGRTLVEAELKDVLNQTFTIDAGIVQTGVYIVRLQLHDHYFASKVFLHR